MLERAAGCLESAGRRFFRDSNGTIRHARPLSPLFGQSHGPNADVFNWLLAFLQTSDNRPPHTESVSANTGRTSVREARRPFLDFLYPPHTQTHGASYLLHTSRKLATRRKRKTVPAPARTYTSNAANLPKESPKTRSVDPYDPLSGEEERRQERERLEVLLGQTRPVDFEEVWKLYALAGRPAVLNSALLACLGRSGRVLDNNRARLVFDDIPIEQRSANDYLHLAHSHAHAGTLPDAKEIWLEAAANGTGAPCLSFVIAACVNEARWGFAQEIWDMRPKPPEYEDWLRDVVHQVNATSFLGNALGLASFLWDQKKRGSFDEFAARLLSHAFSSLKAVENTSTRTLLYLTRRYNPLGILTAEHFLRLVETCQSSKSRATVVKSIVIYRNFRWQMRNVVPSPKLLRSMIHSVASFEITYGILYFLGEFSVHHGKPSPDLYKSALVAFSRIGDAPKVYEVFERLVSDHGPPRSRRLLSPLLYAHARVGDVQQTRREFERVPSVYGLELNTVLWNILLTAYANANDLNGCFETFEDMVKSEVEINPHTLGILMGLCANRGDVENVRRLLALARQNQMEITAPLLDSVVEVYCRNGKFDMAESIAETCLGLDVKGPRVRMWNLLLWHYAFRIDLDSISRVRSRMEAARLKPDGMTYAALMLSLVLIGKTNSARRIFRTLHRNQRVQATEFHYTIILYGYVRERNRDMVHVIFREIESRFQRPGSSPSLLLLKSQLQRDLQLIKSGGKPVESATMRLENAEKLLAEIIADFDNTKLATKEPMPGTGRQRPLEAFPVMFYEYIMNAYGTRGASEKVRELFDKFIASRQPLGSTENVHELAPLRLLNTLMLTYLRVDQHKEIDGCWQMAFPRAVKLATPPSMNDWLSTYLPPANDLDPPRPSSTTQSKGLLVDSENSIALDEVVETKPSILPSFRFLLSRPLSLYMRSLAYRREIQKIRQVVADVENAGFQLSTFNWSTYVQMLATSDKPSDQIEAFTVFEKKFMPNFPGWDQLRRGLGVKPAQAPATITQMENRSHYQFLGKKGRRYWSKVQPDFMQPTYISMVYLASSLLGLRERSIVQGNAEVSAVHSAAPKTVAALGSMPYLRDKFQGVLLRSRQQQGDKPGRLDAYEPYVWTGGVLGVGGRTRASGTLITEEEIAVNATDATSNYAASDTKSRPPRPRDVGIESPPKTLSPQDEHDIETETSLEEARGRPDPDDEALHLEQLRKITSLQTSLFDSESTPQEPDEPDQAPPLPPADDPEDPHSGGSNGSAP